MKCQNCSETATFHITELTSDEPVVLHLCAECARNYLAMADSPEVEEPSALQVKAQFSLETADEEFSHVICPNCGISFSEFRSKGRLGCPHDYVVFQKELEPLLLSVHGAKEHVGKLPKTSPRDTDERSSLIRLRREMLDAVDDEDYERASLLRDQIREISESNKG